MPKAQSEDGRKREAQQVEQVRAIMDAIDAALAWERVDAGLAFTLYRSPSGGEYLVARTVGSDRPWVELYEPVDHDASTWDSLRKTVIDREDMLRRLKLDRN
jgi:hypothetical protein